MASMNPPIVLRQVNLVDVSGRADHQPAPTVDVLVGPHPDQPTATPTADGGILESGARVLALGPDLPAPPGATVVDGAGTWAVPGLWDAHVHGTSAAAMTVRLDTAGTIGPRDTLRRVRDEIAAIEAAGAPRDQLVVGYGHRIADWQAEPTTTALDEVSGHHPVVLIAGDAHHGWLNTAAMDLVGFPRRDTIVAETEWFAGWERLTRLELTDQVIQRAWQRYSAQLAALGITGIRDMEMADNATVWPRLHQSGITGLRVRAGVYTDHLASVLDRGLRTGDELPVPAGGRRSAGMLTMGSYKIIADGSLNSFSAYCFDAYAVEGGLHGALEFTTDELHDMLATAREAGLEAAVHAIGDRAAHDVVAAFEATGAAGTIEHAQLVRPADQEVMARLGLGASLQPLHLLDDRTSLDRLWPGRRPDAFAMGTMSARGIELLLGSDAPVSPVDPWAAIAAAVHRGGPDDEPWGPDQRIGVGAALAASTNGWGTLAPGHPGDVVLLDRDPYGNAEVRAAYAAGESATMAGWLQQVSAVMTIVDGRLTHAR